MESTIAVVVLNWAKYTGRKDVLNPTWFRLDNRLLENDQFYDFSHEEICVWIYILSMASRRWVPGVSIRYSHAKRVSRLSKKAIDSALAKLVKIQCVRVDVPETLHGSNASGTDLCRYNTEQDNTEHNKTNILDHPSASPRFDFESIYKNYPRKMGKQKGIEKAKRDVKSPEDFANLSKAVSRYAKICRDQATDGKFIQHFSSFMTSWRDWLDPDAGTVRTAPAVVQPVYSETQGARLDQDPVEYADPAKVRAIVGGIFK